MQCLCIRFDDEILTIVLFHQFYKAIEYPGSDINFGHVYFTDWTKQTGPDRTCLLKFGLTDQTISRARSLLIRTNHAAVINFKAHVCEVLSFSFLNMLRIPASDEDKSKDKESALSEKLDGPNYSLPLISNGENEPLSVQNVLQYLAIQNKPFPFDQKEVNSTCTYQNPH